MNQKFIPGLATAETEDWTPATPLIERSAVRHEESISPLDASMPVSGRGVASLLIVAIMILSSIAVMMIAGTDTIQSRVTYNPHSPIAIVGDGNFAVQASSEGWAGNGSASAPYQIRDYAINASGFDKAISISNTRAHFVIDTCYLHSATIAQIQLTNVMNGTMVGNLCLNGSYGIFLMTSKYNVVKDNNCSHAERGVFLQSSSYNIVENNSCFDNLEYGVDVISSSYDAVNNNTCVANEYYGMFVFDSDHISVYNNTCVANLDKGIYIYRTTLSAVTMNHCFGNALEGIYVDDADNNRIEDNECSDNDYGIYVTLSTFDLLSGNSCTANGMDGIALISADDNVLDWNDCSQNLITGIYLEFANRNMVTNNTCSNNSANGIHSIGSIDNSLGLNMMSDNGYAGVYLEGTVHHTLLYNTMIHDGVFILGNQLSNWNSHEMPITNTVNGKPLRYFSNASGITIPGGAGQVILANVTNFVVSGQDVRRASCGIEAGFSTQLTIDSNICSNGTYGLVFYRVSYSSISHNSLSMNSIDGAYLYRVNHTAINNNTVSQNMRYGTYVSDSHVNSISGNLFYGNSLFGVYVASTPGGNVISNNTFASNAGTGETHVDGLSQAYDLWGTSFWNSSGTPHGYGNYWLDWTSPDAVPPTGIVDMPYNISGPAGAKDFLPRTTPPTPVVPIPELSVVLVAPALALVVIAFAWRRRYMS